MPQSNTVIQGVVYEENALFFPRGMGWDDWRREVSEIQWRHRSTMWHLGDAFLWGENRFGELYVQGVDPYSEESIQTAMRVCRVFPPKRRRWKLGFSFYQVVYKRSEAEQDELLEMAATMGLTREAFREIRKERDAAAAVAAAAREDALKAAGVTILRPRDQPRLSFLTGQSETTTGLPSEASAGTSATEVLEPEPEPQSATAAPGVEAVDPRESVAEFLSRQRPQIAADAAGWLMTYTRGGQLPADVTEALLLVLAERERLLWVFDAAARCIETGNLQPLAQAVRAARANALQDAS